MKEIIQNFKAQLSAYEKQILPDLLEQHGISPAQFVQIVLSEVKKNEKLLQAFSENPASLFASILAGAEIGLMPSEMIGEFFLIPRSIKQSNGQYKQTVCCQIGYKGLVNILMRSGEITRIHTEVVYDGDTFDYLLGLEPNINHKPNFEIERTAKNIKFAYAVAKNKNGEYQFAVLTRTEIEAIKNMQKYPNELYFNDTKGNNRWMERKAALIQLCKLLPKDYYSKKAIGLDNMIESSDYLTLDDENKIKIINQTKLKSKLSGSIINNLNETE